MFIILIYREISKLRIQCISILSVHHLRKRVENSFFKYVVIAKKNDHGMGKIEKVYEKLKKQMKIKKKKDTHIFGQFMAISREPSNMKSSTSGYIRGNSFFGFWLQKKSQRGS